MTKKNGDLIAVMANTVAEARHALTVPEQRLILWLISQIDREDNALKEHSVCVNEFAQILGSANGRLYEQMEEACDKLQTRVLELRVSSGERVKFNWMHEVRYLDKEGRIRLRFHDNLKPVLIQLRERFCQIPLRTAFQLRGSYSIRWLEMLHARQHMGSFFLTVEELRDWLHIEPGELEMVGNLTARAVEYPRKDLDQKSPLTFTALPRKAGRKLAGWTITVMENKPKPSAKTRKPRTLKAAPAPSVEPAQRAEWAADLAALKAKLAPGQPLPHLPNS
ncbi:MAG: RepB family plasmid replication initiator protein [Verrucomicrobiaceae bacterium]|nr:MAG: RepB family plasmid replication initiator protein [Verrucomicrobiaceae bacterium]